MRANTYHYRKTSARLQADFIQTLLTASIHGLGNEAQRGVFVRTNHHRDIFADAADLPHDGVQGIHARRFAINIHGTLLG